MSFLDKMVQQAERELAEMKRDIEALDINITNLTERRDRKVADEKEARKIYKSLRSKQPDRPVRERVEEIVKEDKPVLDQLAQTNNHKPVGTNQYEVDYDSALQLLKEEGKEFTVTDLMELANAGSRDGAQNKVRRLIKAHKVVQSKAGERNNLDSAKYKVV